MTQTTVTTQQHAAFEEILERIISFKNSIGEFFGQPAVIRLKTFSETFPAYATCSKTVESYRAPRATPNVPIPKAF